MRRLALAHAFIPSFNVLFGRTKGCETILSVGIIHVLNFCIRQNHIILRRYALLKQALQDEHTCCARVKATLMHLNPSLIRIYSR